MENPERSTPHSKSSKMVVFKTTQKNFALIGICPKQPAMQHPNTFNWKLLVSFVALGIGVSFVSVYVFKYANTFAERTQALFILSAGSLVTFILLILALKAKKVFEFINRCGSVVNTSEFLEKYLRFL